MIVKIVLLLFSIVMITECQPPNLNFNTAGPYFDRPQSNQNYHHDFNNRKSQQIPPPNLHFLSPYNSYSGVVIVPTSANKNQNSLQYKGSDSNLSQDSIKPRLPDLNQSNPGQKLTNPTNFQIFDNYQANSGQPPISSGFSKYSNTGLGNTPNDQSSNFNPYNENSYDNRKESGQTHIGNDQSHSQQFNGNLPNRSNKNKGQNNHQRESEQKPVNFQPVTDFAWEFFQRAHNPKELNSVYCPLSPQLLLSYLAHAANGETKSEIVKAIKYNGPNDLHYLKDLMLSNPGNKDLQMATAMFLDMKLSIHERFSSYLKKDIELIPTDFKNSELFSRNYGNWIAKKTKGVFSDVRASVDPTTKMVMTSAVYFKGEWVYKLNPIGFQNFYTKPGKPVQVPTMKLLKKLQYGTINDSAEWISLPYNSNDSMIIILPNEKIGLNDFISQLDINELIASMNADTYGNVTLTLPRFKVETKSSLIEPLMNMGIRKVFSLEAELPNLIATSEHVGVSHVLQQASLEVNEQGSIATSLTAAAVVALSFSPPTPDVDFTVNRPFIAMIFDRKLNFPYFIAKISNPQ